jgi:hypothetical protein
VGHIDVQRVSLALPDGRMLLDEVSLRVGTVEDTAEPVWDEGRVERVR